MGLCVEPPGFVEPQIYRTFTDPDLTSLSSSVSALPEAGLMTFELSYSVRATCERIVDLRMRAKLQVFLPVWLHLHRQPKSDQREWARFVAVLRFHEGGHVHITRRFIKTVYPKLRCCRSSQLERRFNLYLADLQAQHADYDRRTWHGVRQNTPFGPTVLTVRQPAA